MRVGYLPHFDSMYCYPFSPSSNMPEVQCFLQEYENRSESTWCTIILCTAPNPNISCRAASGNEVFYQKCSLLRSKCEGDWMYQAILTTSGVEGLYLNVSINIGIVLLTNYNKIALNKTNITWGHRLWCNIITGLWETLHVRRNWICIIHYQLSSCIIYICRIEVNNKHILYKWPFSKT